MKCSKFDKLARTKHGTLHFIEDNVDDHIDAYWGSRNRWKALPEKLSQMEHFTDWDTVLPIDHGYDKSKPEEALDLDDMRKAVLFRGGKLLSTSMKKGDWRRKLEFECPFGHRFQATPGWCWRVGTGATSVSVRAGTMVHGPRSIPFLLRYGIRSTAQMR